MSGSGMALFPAALDSRLVLTCREKSNRLYDRLDSGTSEKRSLLSPTFIPEGEKFLITASSFTVLAVITIEDLKDLLAVLSKGPVGDWFRQELGNQLSCDLDQTWIRRQYAPAHYPVMHAPHGWHQDGALGYDFTAFAAPEPLPSTILSMATCWIPLVSCGETAPGLEIIRRRFDHLLAPSELADFHLRSGCPEQAFWRPSLAAGDALIFRGDILHRTHVTPGMMEDRTSIELRFFLGHEAPTRLSKDRFIQVP